MFEGEQIINKSIEGFGIVPNVLDCNLGTTTFAVFSALCMYANQEDMAFPAIRTLAEQLSTSEDTIQRAIKRLEHLGLVTVRRPEHQGRGQFNKYLIHNRPQRGATVPPFSKEGSQKGRMGAVKRGAPQGTEQYQGTIEQGSQTFSVDKYEKEREAAEQLRKKMCGV